MFMSCQSQTKEAQSAVENAKELATTLKNEFDDPIN